MRNIGLKENVDRFIEDNPQIEDMVDIKCSNADCNEIIKQITSQIENDSKHPLFVFIDPYGIKMRKAIEEIVRLKTF